MKTKHIFIPVLDVGEIIPFTLKKSDSVQESMEEQDKLREKLSEFIEKLEKNYGENIFYLGFDEIGGKFYERFMFEKGGFLEIMIEAPLALNAHFIDEKKAVLFCDALKKTLKEFIQDSPMAQMLIDSISLQTQDDESLTYKQWETMKEIKND